MSFTYTLYADQIEKLSSVKRELRGDLLFEIAPFSRRVAYHSPPLQLIKSAKELGYRVVLVWDRLMTTNEFSFLIDSFLKIESNLFDAVRVADEGALFYLLHHTEYKIEISLENGSHNLPAILGWYNLNSSRVLKLVLSLQITKDILKSYLNEISCEVEILGQGPISIFYSPRKLLSPLFGKEDQIFAIGTSEESPHKGFLITEAQSGTSMFHIKDISLIEYFDELKSFGLSAVRFDFFKVDSLVIESFYNNDLTALVKLWPRDVTRGLFITNKSDVLFKKLKNIHLKKIDGHFVGEIISVDKEEGLIVSLSHTIKSGDAVTIVTPDGKRISFEIKILKNTNGDLVDSLEESELALIPYHKGVTVKSALEFTTSRL